MAWDPAPCANVLLHDGAENQRQSRGDLACVCARPLLLDVPGVEDQSLADGRAGEDRPVLSATLPVPTLLCKLHLGIVLNQHSDEVQADR